MRVVATFVTAAVLFAAAPVSHLHAFQAATAQKTEAPTPAGKWTMSLETPHGTMVMNFDLRLDGTKLTGTLTNDMIGTSPITGTFADGKVALSAETSGGIAFNFTFKDKDTMTGNLSSPMGDLACSAMRSK